MRDYTYTPLEADEIRLLELQPGESGSELHGTLHTFRLPEDDEEDVVLTREGDAQPVPNAPPYSALSYTWGVFNPKHSTHSIGVLQDGRVCRLGVKPNLWDALQRLREELKGEGEGRFFWVDAISIGMF